MDCPECEKKQKRIAELERMNRSMAESYDALRLPKDALNADRVDFVDETLGDAA